MTDYSEAMSTFIAEGLLPDDSEVISTHNNLVVASANTRTVSRIARVSLMELRVDPGDIRYSHEVAWLLGEKACVLRPTTEMPHQHGDFVFSTFPLLKPVDWSAQDPAAILNAVMELGQAFPAVCQIELRRLNVQEYAQERLVYARSRDVGEDVLKWADAMLDHYRRLYAFPKLVELDPALTHGDLHAGNAVEDQVGKVFFIDLDSIAMGPRLYDLASWHVRRELGDEAPVDQMVAQARQLPSWDEDEYRALVGWKLLSSVTHTLRYTDTSEVFERLSTLDTCGVNLMAPGPWGHFKERR
jgi:hypothetical protein